MQKTPLICAGLLLAGAACAAPAQLMPAHPEQGSAIQSGTGASAVTEADGVRIVITAQKWKRDAQVLDHVTPLHFTIENRRPDPIYVEYAEFHLTSPSGDRYAAIPPYQIKGAIEERLGMREDVVNPKITQEHLYLPGTYEPKSTETAEIDPDLQPYVRYYSTFYPPWGTVELPLPTPEMIRLGLRQGPIESGAQRSGFLYFQKVDPKDQQLSLQIDLMKANREKLRSVRVPFTVESP